MRFQAPTVADTRTIAGPPRTARALLVALTVAALAVAGLVAVRVPAAAIDPDLARVIRCMALIKGAFALAAFAGGFWRLARPAAAWRRAVYVAGPPLMASGAVGLWSLHGLGMAALGLHLGLFAVLAAALTDPDFFTGWPHRRRIQGTMRKSGNRSSETIVR